MAVGHIYGCTGHILYGCTGYIYGCTGHIYVKGGILIIYMGCRRAIYNDIASSTSDFFRPRIKNTLVQGCALKPSGLVHGLLPLGIFLPRTKKNLGHGAILSYRSLRHQIYTLLIYIWV